MTVKLTYFSVVIEDLLHEFVIIILCNEYLHILTARSIQKEIHSGHNINEHILLQTMLTTNYNCLTIFA